MESAEAEVVWLDPSMARLTLARGLLGLSLLGLLVGVLSLAEPLGTGVALVLVVALLVAAAWPVVGLWRLASARVGATPTGLLVQSGMRAGVVSWDAVQGLEIRVEPLVTRVEVHSEAGGWSLRIACRAPSGHRWAQAAAARAPEGVVRVG